MNIMALKHPRLIKIASLIFYFIVLLVSCIKPVYPGEMYLQHSVTVLVALLLVYFTVKNSLSDRSFAFIVAFMMFHILGARWIYSYTPYDQWIRSLTGFSIDSYFGFHRNQYDRLVHFLYGFMMLIPVREIYVRWFGCPVKMMNHLAFLFILSTSMMYEVFEWTISVFLSPQDAEAYNGQQGDYWDAQKDMALALLGALVMLALLQFGKKKNGKAQQ